MELNTNAKLYGYRIIHDGDILFKRCSRSKHFMRVPPGIAIDEQIFNEAVEEGVKFIQVFEREEKAYYSVTIEQFQKKSLFIDRGHGQQLALPLNYWITSKSKEIPQELTVEKQPLPLIFPIKGQKPKTENNRQLSLFEEVI
jgi:hypothetical protein